MASVMFRRMASLRASSSRKNRTWTSLLSGFVGARTMFGLGVLREWWRNEQEWQGLLRLLLAEIDHNSEVVRTITDRSGKRPVDWIGHPDLPSMKVVVWRDLRGGLPRAAARRVDKSVAWPICAAGNVADASAF